MMGFKTRMIAAVCSVALLPCLTGCVVGSYMCNYALLPEKHGRDIEGSRARIESSYPGIVKWYDDKREAGIFRDTSIIGEGGYRLHAVYAPAQTPAEAQGTAIVIHGYGNNHITFLNLVRMYRDSLNYNVFVPDLHYHGTSEGRAVQMGWLDRLDIERWIPLAHSLWPNDFMVIHGVSMGGATTMMVSGDRTPDYVKAFIDDCGYSSVWDQYKHNLKQTYHLPAFPVLNSADIVCRRRYGWGFKEASSVDQLAKCEKPVLFIHGDADDFVPTEHVYKNFEAKKKGYKEMWLAPGSAHAMSYRDHPAEYLAHVRSFLARVKEMDAVAP